ERTRPRNGSTRLVHGSFYPRHVLDLGDASGVIDWEQFGQGPAELDAGEFLAATARIGLAYEPHTAEAARATEAFLAATADLLDEQALTWYRVASLVRLANKRTRRPGDDPALGLPLLNEATRLADAAGMNAEVMR
ncbi:MAG TPA: phosphotransferase, partial [Verrucomicrobiae bacterium]